MPEFHASSASTGEGDPRPYWAGLLDTVIAESAAALRLGPDRDWSVRAGPVEWDCRFTAGHIVDDFLGYATQLAGRRTTPYIAFETSPATDADPEDLIQGIEAGGAVLSSTVLTTPTDIRAWHTYGDTGPLGYSAMGMTEALLHTHDIVQGLGLDFAPSEEPVARTIERLFPNAPDDTDPWTALLWATGRCDLPGRDRVQRWRWQGDGP